MLFAKGLSLLLVTLIPAFAEPSVSGRTVFAEFLQTVVRGETLTYRARIGTPGRTRFPLARSGEFELVFENLAHDFPQRIL